MLLSDMEKKIYGDIRFLPSAKAASLGSAPTVTQVLMARLVHEHELMPTLCASYTEQHLLAPQHLARKGLFAALQLLPAGFAFFDPARFVALLGAFTDQALPSKLSEAFRLVGNAIAVPHSLLTILVGLQSILPIRIDIFDQVRTCWTSTLWSSRMALGYT